MLKLMFILFLAVIVWSAFGALDWILGMGIFGAVFGLVGAVFGVVLGVLGAAFGIVAGVFGAVIGVVAIAFIPILILLGIVALFKAAF